MTTSVEPPLRYIVLEGIDGTGKSTVAKGLRDKLQKYGPAVLTEEPTKGKTGQEIRRLLGEHSRKVPTNEWLQLFEADRREHMTAVVVPSLQRGCWVIQDRSFYSTAAYQGAQGADVADVLKRNRTFAIEPGLVIVLDLPPAEALQRTQKRAGMEAEVFEREDFLTRVSAIFESLSGPNIVRISAGSRLSVVMHEAWAAVQSRFGLH